MARIGTTKRFATDSEREYLDAIQREFGMLFGENRFVDRIEKRRTDLKTERDLLPAERLELAKMYHGKRHYPVGEIADFFHVSRNTVYKVSRRFQDCLRSASEAGDI